MCWGSLYPDQRHAVNSSKKVLVHTTSQLLCFTFSCCLLDHESTRARRVFSASLSPPEPSLASGSHKTKRCLITAHIGPTLNSFWRRSLPEGEIQPNFRTLHKKRRFKVRNNNNNRKPIIPLGSRKSSSLGINRSGWLCSLSVQCLWTRQRQVM